MDTRPGPDTSQEWFFSYSSADRDLVGSIERILASRGTHTFFDRHHLHAGLPWFDELEAALRRATGVLVFLGPSGLGSIQKRELHFALARQAQTETGGAGRPLRVVPVLLPGYDRSQLAGFAALNTWVEIADPARPDELIRALDSDPGAAPAAGPPRAAACPYRGLNAFREEDAPLFFGRDAEADRLLHLVRAHRFVAVVGPSGTGKSSLVRAGLLPRLRLERPPQPTWDVVVFSPGRRPFYNAASSLSRLWLPPTAPLADVVEESEKIDRQLTAGDARLASYVHEAIARLSQAERLLVVVDQFEELFTQNDEATRQRFAQSLLGLADEDACSVVITLRADYYGRAIELGPELSTRLERAQLNVGPILRDQLRTVIVGPAARARVDFEPGLVERILADVEQQPGSLPLLEFALTELWNAAPTGDLTHEAYTRIGRVSGAITTRADGVLSRLDPGQRQRAASVLTRLVKVTSTVDEGADTRQILRLSDLDASGRDILEEFARARLVVLGGERGGEATAEVAHEALIRNWKSLREWIDNDVQFLRWRQTLEIFITEWERTGRDATALLGGVLLHDAEKWLKSHNKALTESERSFIRASGRRQLGSKTRRWAAAAVLLAAAAGGGLYYRYLRSDAHQVALVLADAPLREALSSSRSDDDPYVEAVVAWFSALARSQDEQRARDVLETARYGISDCAAASIATARRSGGRDSDEPLEEVVRLFVNDGFGDNVRCLGVLPLTPSERASAIEALARPVVIERDRADPTPEPEPEPEPHTYSELRGLVWRAGTLLTLGAREQARVAAWDAILALAESDEPRGQLLSALAENAGEVLTQGQRNDLLSAIAAQPRNDYYLEKAQYALNAAATTLQTLDGFVKPKDGTRYVPDIGEQTGRILAREIRRGSAGEGVAAAERVLAQLLFPDYDAEFRASVTTAVLSPLPQALADTGHLDRAVEIAERLLAAANEVPQEDLRSRSLSIVSRVLARAGQLARARDIANRCSRSLDKLYAYAAILDAGSR